MRLAMGKFGGHRSEVAPFHPSQERLCGCVRAFGTQASLFSACRNRLALCELEQAAWLRAHRNTVRPPARCAQAATQELLRAMHAGRDARQ